MGNQHQRCAVRAGLRHQCLHHFGGGGGVQVACGLVGQEQGGAVNQRTGNRHALQLAAAELLGQAAAHALQTHGFQHGLHPAVVWRAQQQQGKGHVLRHIQVAQHVKGLENKAHLLAAQQRTGVIVELAQIDADIGLLEDEVEELQQARSKLTVAAARPGVVSHRTQFNGEKFAVGTSVFMGLSVAEVADAATIVVQAVVPEPEAFRVKVGQRARVSIAGGNTVLDAKVTELGKVYRTKSRNQPVTVRDVRLVFDGDTEQLKPGATVSVTLDVGTAGVAVAVQP